VLTEVDFIRHSGKHGPNITAHNNLRVAKNLIVSDDIKVRKPGIEQSGKLLDGQRCFTCEKVESNE
jgi:hypothetical protein